MNVKAIMQAATTAIKGVKSLSTTNKVMLGVAAGGLFGAGVLAGNLLGGDTYEKQEQPVAQQPQPQAKPAEKQEPEFKYVPPEVGVSGIASSDTTFYTGTRQPSTINYYDKAGNLRHQASFDRNGEFDGYRVIGALSDNDESAHFIKYDKNGKNYAHGLYYRDGSGEETENFFGRPIYTSWDKNGNLTRCTNEYEDGKTSETIYKNDGTKVTTRYQYGVPTSQTSEKNGRVLQEKKYNSDGTLKNTIIPQYNNEGDVVRRDTVPNK